MALSNGESLLFFIVREKRRQTVYAGDYDNCQLLIIARDATEPQKMQFPSNPQCGALLKNDQVLAVSCGLNVRFYSLAADPLKPALTR